MRHTCIGCGTGCKRTSAESDVHIVSSNTHRLFKSRYPAYGLWMISEPTQGEIKTLYSSQPMLNRDVEDACQQCRLGLFRNEIILISSGMYVYL